MPVPRVDYATAEPQTLDEIRDWHRGIVEALVEQRTSVQRAVRDGAHVAARFVVMTEADLDNYYDIQRRELDRLTMLNLVASAEAAITIDFFRRVRGRLKDRLSRAYRAWHRSLLPKRQRRPDFDEDGILTVLKKTNVVDNNLIGRFRECLPARHWIGHGRRWEKPIAVDRFDPEDVYDRAEALLRALPR